MQDLKNNAGNKDLGQKGHDQAPHPFDQKLSSRLLDAEVAPDEQLMDQMFAQLQSLEDSEKPKQAKVEKGKMPVTLTGKGPLRSKLPYAAALIGILIVLSIGLLNLGRKDPVVLPPEGLTRLNKSNLANRPIAPDTNRALAAANRQDTVPKGGVAPATKPGITSNKSDAKLALTEDALPTNTEKTATRKKPSNIRTPKRARPALSAKAKTRMAVAKSRDLVAKQMEVASSKSQNTGLDAKPVSTLDAREQQVAMAKSTGLTANNHPVTTTPIDQGDKATGQGSKIITSAIDLDQLNAKPYNQTELTDREIKSRRKPKKRGGFFRGLVRKISNGAKSISDDVIQQDEDKTVINIGIVAITTYK